MFKRKKYPIVGYIGKSGVNKSYKLVAKFTTTENVERVKLESFGNEPISFWVDKSKLVDAPEPDRTKGEQKSCWECGMGFNYAYCAWNGGEWSDDYCGC